MYLVKYSAGSWDDYYTQELFVTDDETIAQKYCTRLNDLVERLRQHHLTMDDDQREKLYIRITAVDDFDNCRYEVIPFVNK